MFAFELKSHLKLWFLREHSELKVETTSTSKYESIRKVQKNRF